MYRKLNKMDINKFKIVQKRKFFEQLINNNKILFLIVLRYIFIVINHIG
jgi:hypothetical protein